MLRITRVNKSVFIQSGSDEEKIFSEYSNLAKLVKRHLSPVTASIFAIPTVQENSDEIEWSSELKGQPVQLNSLPKNEQQQAKKLLDDRISAIARLADELPQQTPDTEKLRALLKQALHYPGDDAIYVINGQPVITFWGIGDKTKSTSVPILASTIPVTNGAQKQRKKSRFFSFLGWLALLALLAFLWYWLANNSINCQDYNLFNDIYQQNSNCTKKELESLPKVFGAEFVGGFPIFTSETKNRALKEMKIIGAYLSKNENATVLITLHTPGLGPNYRGRLSYKSGFMTAKDLLNARFQSIVNGIMKVSGVSRRQIKKNAYRYNRTNRIVTFTMNNT